MVEPRPLHASGPVAFYISGHGFGHAARDIEVLNTLHERAPDLRVIVRTAAPAWLFDLTLRAPAGWEPLECDTGVVQVDSLEVDVNATIRQAAAFHETLDARAAVEADWLRRRGVSLVVGDIPPLAFAAADAAGLPSIALGNFTWDWIYGAYPETAALAPWLPDTIRQACAHADLALRLPLNAGFAPFGSIQDVPLIARRSRQPRGELRRHFGLPDDVRLVLPSFGGYGLRDVDVAALAALEGYVVVITADLAAARRGREMVSGSSPARLPSTIRFLDEGDLYAEGFRYEDLVAAVDVVVTKPGYSIIAECAANGTALLYTPRGRFPEYDVLVREMPRYVRCDLVSNDDLRRGRWQEPLDRVMMQPRPPEVDVTGADVVAGAILSVAAGLELR